MTTSALIIKFYSHSSVLLCMRTFVVIATVNLCMEVFWVRQEDGREVEVASKPSEAETSDDDAASSRVLDESNASDLFSISARQKIDMLNESLPNSPASFSQLVGWFWYLQVTGTASSSKAVLHMNLGYLVPVGFLPQLFPERTFVIVAQPFLGRMSFISPTQQYRRTWGNVKDKSKCDFDAVDCG